MCWTILEKTGFNKNFVNEESATVNLRGSLIIDYFNLLERKFSFPRFFIIERWSNRKDTDVVSNINKELHVEIRAPLSPAKNEKLSAAQQ